MNQKAFKALSDPTRLHVVEFLSKMCCGKASIDEDGGVEGPTAGEVCCHITGAEKITSTVSHHLHELEEVGIIDIERKGKTMLCTLQPKVLEELGTYLTDLSKGHGQCCCGPDCGCGPDCSCERVCNCGSDCTCGPDCACKA
ncbi:MAG TPA: metalloregulator ArsR/SmtB family transcription factor [Fimbriimonadaceae bacterium]